MAVGLHTASTRIWVPDAHARKGLTQHTVAHLRANRSSTLQWRHNERDCVSNHQLHNYLLNRLFGRRSKKISKLRFTGLCERNSPVTGGFHTQRASNAENVSIWWRHHGLWSYSVRQNRMWVPGGNVRADGQWPCRCTSKVVRISPLWLVCFTVEWKFNQHLLQHIILRAYIIRYSTKYKH